MQNLPSKSMAVAEYVLFKKSFTLHKRLVQFFEYLSHNSCGQRKRAFFLKHDQHNQEASGLKVYLNCLKTGNILDANDLWWHPWKISSAFHRIHPLVKLSILGEVHRRFVRQICPPQSKVFVALHCWKIDTQSLFLSGYKTVSVFLILKIHNFDDKFKPLWGLRRFI